MLLNPPKTLIIYLTKYFVFWDLSVVMHVYKPESVRLAFNTVKMLLPNWWVLFLVLGSVSAVVILMRFCGTAQRWVVLPIISISSSVLLTSSRDGISQAIWYNDSIKADCSHTRVKLVFVIT